MTWQQSKPIKVGFDMDGVLCNWTKSALKNIKDIFNLEIKEEEIIKPNVAEIIYDRLPDRITKWFDTPQKIYEKICPKEFFRNLEPYPNAIEVVKQISSRNNVVFITKPLGWSTSPQEKIDWLVEHLDIKNTNMKVIMVDRPETKSLIDVDIIIDDDPRVIKKIDYAVPILVERPWNKDFRELESIRTVKNITELTFTITEITQDLLQY